MCPAEERGDAHWFAPPGRVGSARTSREVSFTVGTAVASERSGPGFC